jgi:hypothetical protein
MGDIVVVVFVSATSGQAMSPSSPANSISRTRECRCRSWQRFGDWVPSMESAAASASSIVAHLPSCVYLTFLRRRLARLALKPLNF